MPANQCPEKYKKERERQRQTAADPQPTLSNWSFVTQVWKAKCWRQIGAALTPTIRRRTEFHNLNYFKNLSTKKNSRSWYLGLITIFLARWSATGSPYTASYAASTAESSRCSPVISNASLHVDRIQLSWPRWSLKIFNQNSWRAGGGETHRPSLCSRFIGDPSSFDLAGGQNSLDDVFVVREVRLRVARHYLCRHTTLLYAHSLALL